MRTRILVFLLLVLSLPAAASVTGVIINADGQPVSGAKVSLYPPETIEAHRLRLVSKTPERQAIAATTTDSKGNFTFESPKNQPVVEVEIEANGYAPEVMRLLADDDAGAIALVAAPMQRGTITAAGKPLAGATVVWTSGDADFLTKTDAEGHYSVPNPSKWADRLIVVHPDYAMIDVASQARTTPKLDQALTPGVPISGRVVGQDGKSGAGKATVIVDDFPAATTADDGSFTIAHAPSSWQEIAARSGDLTGLHARAGSASMNIRLAKSAKVTGVVRDAKSQLPLANAEVRLGPDAMAFGRRRARAFFGASGAAFESVLTDAKGNFAISTEPGRYNVSAVYPDSTITNAQISLAAGQSANKVLYATRRARVSGTVIDEDRRPVAGAEVMAGSARRGAMPPLMMPFQPGFSTYSGPDGRFVLRNVSTDADVQVDAVKKGFPSAQSATMRLASGERKTGLTITIPRGVALTGRVTDANGRPISGVAVDPVETTPMNRGGMVRRVVNMMARERDDNVVRTGTDGTFTLRVKQGTYDVVFKREGFSMKILHGTSVDATTRPVEVKLDPSVEISGRVVRGGAGVEGATVNAISPDSGPASATTASDGSFTITDLSPGQLMLDVMKPDSFIQQIRPVTAPARDVLIELPNGGRITGRVVDKATHNPVTAFQAGISFQRGAGGMMIALPPMLKDFSSDDGTFVLDNVPPGPTQLVVSAAGYTRSTVPGLNVEDGKSLDNVEVQLDTGVRLAGRVTGPDGAPLSGVMVREVSGNGMRGFGPAAGANATTDPNGEYSIDAVDPGEKTFTFAHDGYLSVDKTITLSGRDARLDAQLSNGMTISGQVVTDSGAPVGDANVNAASASNSMFGNPNARTDPNGNFQMTGLAPGHYSFYARKDGVGQGTVRDFDVATGGAVRIVIPAGGTIVGHVTGLTDADLASTTVSASSATGSGQAAVDSSGAYRIDAAPTGTVRVIARTGRGFGGGGKTSGVVSVEVDPGSTATADIQFKSNTVVSGRVTRNGQPMSNVMVTFGSRSGAGSSTTTTDNSGTYQVTGLDDGKYTVGVIDIDRSNAFSSTYDVHGSGTFDIDIKTASLRGTVVDSGTGQPIPAANIQVQSGTPGFFGTRAAQTDPSGAFVIDNVASGSYHIVVEKEGYGHDMRDVVVGDSAPDDLQFKLSPSDGVTITVVDARDNRQITANAVRIVDSSGRVVTAGGSFRVSGAPEPIKLTLAAGSYTVTLNAMGYASKVVTVTSPSQVTVALSPGGTLVVRSHASTRQSMRLIDSLGAVSRGFMADPAPMTTTINNVASGSYTLQVLDSAGAVVNSVPVTIIDGQQAVVDI